MKEVKSDDNSYVENFSKEKFVNSLNKHFRSINFYCQDGIGLHLAYSPYSAILSSILQCSIYVVCS